MAVSDELILDLIEVWLDQAEEIEEAAELIKEILPEPVPPEWMILLDNKAETLTKCATELGELL